MNRNLLLALAAATLVAIALVMLLGDERGAPTVEAGPLLPGLAEQVNAIDAVDVVAPGGATTVRLRRDDARWQVAERDGYEADFRQVVDLLRTLAEAQRDEPRTDNPDWYGRLGVAETGDAEATGRRIDFPGTDLPSLIVGQVDPTDSGSYVRIAGESRAWLADRVIELAADPVSWLEPGIMDIPGEDLVAITVTHPDGETVVLEKPGEAGDWVLRDVPEGRSAGPAWKRDALANGIRGLNLDDVRRFDPPHPDDTVITELLTADGLRFSAHTWRDGDGDDATAWVHFTVADAGDAVPPPIEPVSDADDADTQGPAEEPPAQQASAERLANAVAVDGRLSPWAYAIPARRADDLAPRLDDLLEPVDEE
ncbi:DUF4340 domain-containing protein [Wenzhouxiangella sp. XN79A]|uniref:DUF4340 domain-containing protein n=1 Tax=Wenzhouxiangella sp. XN79A TaxID=2724193 RepID=UPI00144AE307|nr:DUF4340 domain-containing protein [Wenzhouxiangella sp. XN79A]NKI35979.1 DUF4340 domain-containing protein [Wenzhouxiangella sp. XN79A]